MVITGSLRIQLHAAGQLMIEVHRFTPTLLYVLAVYTVLCMCDGHARQQESPQNVIP